MRNVTFFFGCKAKIYGSYNNNDNNSGEQKQRLKEPHQTSPGPASIYPQKEPVLSAVIFVTVKL